MRQFADAGFLSGKHWYTAYAIAVRCTFFLASSFEFYKDYGAMHLLSLLLFQAATNIEVLCTLAARFSICCNDSHATHLSFVYAGHVIPLKVTMRCSIATSVSLRVTVGTPP